MRDSKDPYFILNGKEVKRVTLNEWVEWYQKFSTLRSLADDRIRDVRVSTVFLGIDHNLFGQGPPILFETMIFGGPENDYQVRASAYDDALEIHKVACARAFGPHWETLIKAAKIKRESKDE